MFIKKKKKGRYILFYIILYASFSGKFIENS
jgi:hypothetical protein